MAHRIVGQPIGKLEGIGKVSGKACYAGDVTLPGLIWGKTLRARCPTRVSSGSTRPEPTRWPGCWRSSRPGTFRISWSAAACSTCRCWRAIACDSSARRSPWSPPSIRTSRTRRWPHRRRVRGSSGRLRSARGDPVRRADPSREPGGLRGGPTRRPYPNVQSVLRFKLGDVEAGFREADLRAHLPHAARPPGLSRASRGSRGDRRGEPGPGVGVEQDAVPPQGAPVPCAAPAARADPREPDADRRRLRGKGSLMDLPLAYHLARVTGRPVKMLMRYAEELMAGNPRHPSVITMRTGVSKDGRIVARRVKALFNSGAYAAFKPAPSVNLGGTGMGAGVYRIPNLLIESFCVYSNNIPCGHARSPGEPQMVFAGESHMDMIASRARAGSGRPSAAKPLARRGSSRQRPPSRARPRQRHARGRAQGEPLCRAQGRSVDRTRHGDDPPAHRRRIHECPGAPETSGTITLSIALPDTGTGAHLVLRQVVAEVLGLAARRGRDRDRQHGRLRDRFRRGWEPGHAHRRPRRVSCRREAQGADPDGGVEARAAGECLGRGRPGGGEGRPDAGGVALLRREGSRAVTSFTAQVAEVAVDPATGQVTVRHFTTAHDVGTIINPIGHQGQIEGGLIQGLGFALIEEMKTEEGRISTLSLGDFKLPTIQDIPPLTTVILHGPVGPGPFNAKAIGEGSIARSRRSPTRSPTRAGAHPRSPCDRRKGLLRAQREGGAVIRLTVNGTVHELETQLSHAPRLPPLRSRSHRLQGRVRRRRRRLHRALWTAR